ncbi:hypothetical protein M747DRAFT_283652 [Aspergillus niger ATCC 13496]|uniref:Nephrocystin 3-like N-terminal domain-containing protein n=1 Tax=Aspergillus niger ATCC 13496 TaxID=1353008 RepID=A0A370BV12_ASPNG|nr:hypothetical protein M747DRAFT_283652 [Aspergillus niger ATCC 13496]
MGGEAIVGPALSGQFYAGTGKQYNFGSVSGEKIYMGTGDVQVFSTLPFAKSACFNSREREHDSFCLEGTRVDLLKDIAEWIDADHDEGIFWLSGMAGTGKTTVARTVARNYDQQSRLAASFFFTDENGDANSADIFASAVACQLASFDTSMKNAIQDVLERCPLLPYQGLSEQWTRLVKEPLAAFTKKPNQNPLLIVVDGLDLCPEKNDQRLILRLLSSITHDCENKVIVFLASRPESAIRSELSGIRHKTLRLQDINRRIVDSDIKLLLNHEIGKIMAPFEPFETKSLWGSGIIPTFVIFARGLFLWAATACQYIRNAKTPQIVLQRLRNIDAERPEKGTPIEVLYKIYTSILDDSVNDAWDEHEKATYWNSTRRILCAITYNRGMLSKPALANLIQMDDIDSMLEDLHSIIRIPEDNNKQIGFLHISLHKFVTTMEHPSLYLTPQQSHSMLADTCLDLLNEACGQDSGKLQNGAEPKTQKVSQALQYACTKWVDHLCDGEESLPRNSKAFVFLKTHGKSWTKLLILSGQGFLVERLGDRLVEMIEKDREDDKRFVDELLTADSNPEISAQDQ